MTTEDFIKAVKATLRIVDPEDLAGEFKVSKGTVQRWAAGVSFPAPEARRQIASRMRDLFA